MSAAALSDSPLLSGFTFVPPSLHHVFLSVSGLSSLEEDGDHVGTKRVQRSALNVGLSSSEHTQSQTLPRLTPIIRTGFSDSGLTYHY